MVFDSLGDRGRKTVPINAQCAASRDLVLVGTRHDYRIAAPHLFVQQADGVVLMVVRAEAIGTDQLGQAVGLVRVSAAHGSHFMQNDLCASLRCLPCCFRAGKTAADDMNRF